MDNQEKIDYSDALQFSEKLYGKQKSFDDGVWAGDIFVSKVSVEYAKQKIREAMKIVLPKYGVSQEDIQKEIDNLTK